MPKTPLKPEDMNQFAGQFVEAESPMLDMLPEGSTFAVGGDYRKHADDTQVSCFVCGGPVFMDRRDFPLLATVEKVVYLCPTCYFKMEPKEVKG